jgi:ankyrin repeat protein
MHKLPEPYQSLFEAMLWDCGAEAIPELVRKGADLAFRDPNTGRTALYAATMSDRVRAIEALLQHGADPNQRLTYRSPVDGRVEADRVALHYASSGEAAAALIRAGADVNAADAVGTTPLMCAAFHGHTAVVRALLAAGAPPLARQQKRRGHKAHTARELAESKIEFFREAICDKNREAVERRLQCYQEIRDILSEAERGVVARRSTE